ncbi:unnamed protein product [Mytilus coruscus]|uniref:Uncharacterized protein n=1 Tax=Mytilus coruscus TaxID=42192 RepID=A0A6J8EAM9_MYTCO|nr:unnamed protein product [Mytilus coruscus]
MEHGIPRSYYRVDIRDGRIENVVPGNKSSYTHYLRRQYGTQQATYNERGVSFQRIISTATSKYNIKSSRLRDLKTTWDHLVPTFHAWFVSNESEKFKSHLIKAVTDQAQLDGHFSNNRVESTNNNVKDWVGRSGKVTLPVFNRKVEEYVTCQQQEFEMAIYANGPYDLASTYLFKKRETYLEWAERRKKTSN